MLFSYPLLADQEWVLSLVLNTPCVCQSCASLLVRRYPRRVWTQRLTSKEKLVSQSALLGVKITREKVDGTDEDEAC